MAFVELPLIPALCCLCLLAELDGQTKDSNTLVLTEGTVLGGGAFSRVSIVSGWYVSACVLPVLCAASHLIHGAWGCGMCAACVCSAVLVAWRV